MKICEYCGGNADTGCGATSDGRTHYSKIDCAEKLKLDLGHAKVDRDSCCAGTEELRRKLDAVNLQIDELRRVLTLAQDHLHALLCIKYTGGKQCHATCQDAKDVLAGVVQKQKCDKQYSLEDCYGYCGMQLGHDGACGRG
jgi:hypothetical protein